MGKEAICLDTNIIVGKGRQIIKEWKKNKREPVKKVVSRILDKKEGFLFKASNYYSFLTSIISRYEFIKALKDIEEVKEHILIEIYQNIKEYYVISEITFNEIGNFLTYNFFEDLIKCNLDLEDGIQLFVAFKRKLPFITGNTRHLENMRKFYSEVFCIEEIYDKIKLKKQG